MGPLVTRNPLSPPPPRPSSAMAAHALLATFTPSPRPLHCPYLGCPLRSPGPSVRRPTTTTTIAYNNALVVATDVRSTRPGGDFSRRHLMAFVASSLIFTQSCDIAESSVGFREYVSNFEGYVFNYPQSWIQVRGAGADIFFRDPYILDENMSLEISSPSSSRYRSVEDLGSPEEAGKKVLKQYLTEFMSTRLGVRRESKILSTSSKVADDGKVYYQVEINIKSFANNNELAVMPQDRVTSLEWDRRYLSVLGVENNRLYELRLQTPEKVFLDAEQDLRQVMDSFRVIKVVN